MAPEKHVFNRRTRRTLAAIGRRMDRAFNGVWEGRSRAAAQPYIRRYTSLFRAYKAALGQL